MATGADLQAAMVALIRAFGLHHPDRTPCGVAVPVSEAHALSELADRGAMTASELCRVLGLEKSTVSRLVGQLERRGWVVRERCAEDARRSPMELTAEGRRMADQLAAARARRFDALLSRLPEGERAAAVRGVRLLVDAARDTA
ncbi:MAG: MarR family transcriptional regulator [Actinomycetota bacterium]